MADTSKISDPFKPGTGTPPPHFAGRDALLERIDAEAHPLYQTKPSAPRRDIILHGPEGSGKTALLRKIEVKLSEEAEDSDFVVMRWTPAIELQSLRTAINAVMTKGFWSGFLETLSKTRRLRLFGFGVDFDAPEPPNLRSALMGGLESGPFVVLIDDAQDLKPRVVSALLNTGRQLRVEDRPFLLILAGTDELLATLNKVDETFCERSMLLSLEPLSKDDAKKALKDLEGLVESDAWPVLLDDKRHDLYPLYVQEIGAEAIWQLNDELEVEGDSTPKITKFIAKKTVAAFHSRIQDIRELTKHIGRRGQIEQLESTNADLEMSAKEYGRQLADAQSENSELKSSNGRLEDTLRKQRQELADMQSKNDDLRSRNAKLEDATEEHGRQLEEMRSENDNLKFRNAELKEAARDRDQQLDAMWLVSDDLRSRNAKLEDTARKNRLQLASKKSQSDDELERVARELADMKSQNAKLEDAARELEDAARESDEQLASMKSEYDKIIASLNQAKEQHPMKWRWLFGAETPGAIEGE